MSYVRRYYVTFGSGQSPTGSTGYREVVVRATESEGDDQLRARYLIFEVVGSEYCSVYSSLEEVHPFDRVLLGDSINMMIGKLSQEHEGPVP